MSSSLHDSLLSVTFFNARAVCPDSPCVRNKHNPVLRRSQLLHPCTDPFRKIAKFFLHDELKFGLSTSYYTHCTRLLNAAGIIEENSAYAHNMLVAVRKDHHTVLAKQCRLYKLESRNASQSLTRSIKYSLSFYNKEKEN